ncbi:hypothetical protein C8J56DRAFT_1132401 [Mycena floridula]|nr:hypothetical protein C8J56DRAFT_1132401 [Mycena floridula]
MTPTGIVAHYHLPSFIAPFSTLISLLLQHHFPFVIPAAPSLCTLVHPVLHTTSIHRAPSGTCDISGSSLSFVLSPIRPRYALVTARHPHACLGDRIQWLGLEEQWVGAALGEDACSQSFTLSTEGNEWTDTHLLHHANHGGSGSVMKLHKDGFGSRMKTSIGCTATTFRDFQTTFDDDFSDLQGLQLECYLQPELAALAHENVSVGDNFCMTVSDWHVELARHCGQPRLMIKITAEQSFNRVHQFAPPAEASLSAGFANQNYGGRILVTHLRLGIFHGPVTSGSTSRFLDSRHLKHSASWFTHFLIVVQDLKGQASSTISADVRITNVVD